MICINWQKPSFWITGIERTLNIVDWRNTLLWQLFQHQLQYRDDVRIAESAWGAWAKVASSCTQIQTHTYTSSDDDDGGGWPAKQLASKSPAS